MLCSEAQLAANRKNAARSTGPKTEEGKAQSRRNAWKHGLTGSGVVLPEADALEVARKTEAYRAELAPSDEVARDLVDRAALLAVRMKRSVDQQTASLAEHVRRVEAEFVPPEGLDEAEEAQARSEAVRRAMFDPSKEAALARKYELAAERSYFRCLKALSQSQKADRAEAQAYAHARVTAEAEAEAEAMMGSFFQEQAKNQMMDDEFDAMDAERNIPLPRRPDNSPQTARFDAEFELPISAGRRC